MAHEVLLTAGAERDLELIDEARQGLVDVAAGYVTSARGTIRSIKRHRL